MSQENLTYDKDLSNLACFGASLCAIIGTTVNALSMFVIARRKVVRNHSLSPLLFLQAMTDFWFCSTSLPLKATGYYLRGHFFDFIGPALCHAWPFLFYSNISVSAFGLALISINRAISVLKPSRLTKYFNWKKCLAYHGVLWMFSLIFFVFPLTGVWGEIGYAKETFSCEILHDLSHSNPLRIFAGVAFTVPLTIMITCYILIKIKIHQITNSVFGPIQCVGKKGKIQRQESALNRSTFIAFFTYIILTLPCALIMAIHPMPPYKNLPGLHVITYILFWIAAIVNPFIYVFNNEFYKKAFIKSFPTIFKRCQPSEAFESSHITMKFSTSKTNLKKMCNI